MSAIENHAIRLLQESRTDVHTMRSEMTGMRVDLTRRIDGSTLLLDPFAGAAYDRQQHLTGLESKSS